MGGLTSNAAALLRRRIAGAGPEGDEALMLDVLRLCAKWRSQMLSNTVQARDGLVVQAGPFAGMAYDVGASEGALVARLLGSYEAELHPYLSAFANAGLDLVVDIGCAEGYYAVGLARMLPHATIHAYDIEPGARELCARLAEHNGVADRVKIGGEFKGEDFAAFVGRRALFILDIEGGERDLLDPARFPALEQLQFIVETHPGAVAGITDELIRRFAPSHNITVVRRQAKTTPLPPWVQALGDLDSLLAVWEWRATPTPWLVMRPKTAV